MDTELLLKKHEIELLLLNNNSTFEELSLKPICNKLFMVDITDVSDILYSDEWTDGVYGFLNYQFDLKNDKLLGRNHTINNKKLIINNDLSLEAKQDNYGILELFTKDKNEIKSINRYSLLKNGNINFINKTNYDKINIEELSDDFIITKIYKIDGKKIIFQSQMTKNEYIIEDNNKKFIDYKTYMSNTCKDVEMLDYMLSFNNIDKLKRMINKNMNRHNIEDVVEYDFSKVINNIKITNRYDNKEYNELINKHFGYQYDVLYDSFILRYGIKNNMIESLKIVLEILIRIYIDIKLKNDSYCLNKSLTVYIPLDDDIYLTTKNKTFISRYILKKITQDSIINIVNLIFNMLKTTNLKTIITTINTTH